MDVWNTWQAEVREGKWAEASRLIVVVGGMESGGKILDLLENLGSVSFVLPISSQP